jgi:uncharacterized membrane-anchored protein YjiN (DUF445 family)
MNKSFLTNFICLLISIVGYFSPSHSDLIFMTGIFALSGGITNWLAIHMLFEKVPLLYGSGVVPNRFEEFKAAIKCLIVEQFFTREHMEKIFKENTSQAAGNITDMVDFDRIFIGLTETIENSQLGGMLKMVGGKEALEPLREPITLKLKDIISDLASEKANGEGDDDFTGSLITEVEHIIDKRLEELTPENVKKIVKNMIKKHLGWLVVWGGIFGGSIGLIVGILG